MKKVLFVASISEHIKKFHIPYLKYFKERNCIVDVAVNRTSTTIDFCDTQIDIPIERNPFKKNNLKAYKKLKKLLEHGEYDLIHCHTPVASILTRIAARKSRKNGTAVIYTAHGFHFFKGAPIINWLLYYPIEWLCSFFTDCLITINQEDYVFAKKHLKTKKIIYVPGVGIDLNKFENSKNNREQKRKEIGIPSNAIMLFSVGELNKNKNHKAVINSLSKIATNDIYYVIAGKGDQEDYLKALVRKYNIEEKVIFLGYRDDVENIYAAADIFVFPSYREGLPVSLMEAMASGLPCVVSKIRGNTDLIENGNGGFVCHPSDITAFKEKILTLSMNEELRKNMSKINIKNVKKFSIDTVALTMKKIYNEVLQ